MQTISEVWTENGLDEDGGCGGGDEERQILEFLSLSSLLNDVIQNLILTMLSFYESLKTHIKVGERKLTKNLTVK